MILASCQQIRLFQKVADTNKTAEDILSSAPPFIKAFKEVASSGNWGSSLGQFLGDKGVALIRRNHGESGREES